MTNGWILRGPSLGLYEVQISSGFFTLGGNRLGRKSGVVPVTSRRIRRVRELFFPQSMSM